MLYNQCYTTLSFIWLMLQKSKLVGNLTIISYPMKCLKRVTNRILLHFIGFLTLGWIGMEKGRAVFRAYMLGKLSFCYGDEAFQMKCNDTSKVMQLFLLLLRAGKEGMPKVQLLEALYGNEETQDTKNAFRILVFRLRKLLAGTILPDDHYIEVEKGIYQLGGHLDVWIDADAFEQQGNLALLMEDKEEGLKKLWEACHLYTGEFLPMMADEKWALMERTRYKELYFECLRKCCKLLQERKMYEEALKLCDRAVKDYPFEEWQLIQIDCLLALNRYQEALNVYENAASIFFEEMGNSPSEKMLSKFRAMSGQLHYAVGNLAEIKDGLEEKEFSSGAYYCSYPSFIDTYRVVARMIERSGQSVFLMLCTLTDGWGNLLEKEEILSEQSMNLGYAVGMSLRRGDLFTRYSLNQFLVLLIGIKQEDCDLTYGRIVSRFRKKCPGQKVQVRYYVSSIAEIRNGKSRLTFGSSKNCWNKGKQKIFRQ